MDIANLPICPLPICPQNDQSCGQYTLITPLDLSDQNQDQRSVVQPREWQVSQKLQFSIGEEE